MKVSNRARRVERRDWSDFKFDTEQLISGDLCDLGAVRRTLGKSQLRTPVHIARISSSRDMSVIV
jgi:hypothetical protein